MGVNVRCEVCGKFIRRVEIGNIGSIQTDEICDECDKQIRIIYQEYKECIKKYNAALTKLNDQSSKEYKRINYRVENLYKEFKKEFDKSNEQLKKTHKKYMDDIQSLFTTTNAEIGDKIRAMGRYFK